MSAQRKEQNEVNARPAAAERPPAPEPETSPIIRALERIVAATERTGRDLRGARRELAAHKA